MNPYALLAGLGILAATHYFAFTSGQNNVQVKNDKAVIEQLKNNQQAILDYHEKLKQAEVKRDEQINLSNRLAADIKQLRVKGICRGAMPTNAQTGADKNGASRVLSDRIDTAFEQLQTGVGGLVEKCDNLNIEAIRVNSLLR